jgi:hypothetical protein
MILSAVHIFDRRAVLFKVYVFYSFKKNGGTKYRILSFTRVIIRKIYKLKVT